MQNSFSKGTKRTSLSHSKHNSVKRAHKLIFLFSCFARYLASRMINDTNVTITEDLFNLIVNANIDFNRFSNTCACLSAVYAAVVNVTRIKRAQDENPFAFREIYVRLGATFQYFPPDCSQCFQFHRKETFILMNRLRKTSKNVPPSAMQPAF